ncbi:SusC/RagA family TonB-linked outer membrane protein [Sphingobacterium sp. N143]|uniref:SusC/RagA family TonB-linked outer membrane protein n=1 Tax=Sphingobacterium sp. N143 TaxID=2746727 RepID=UPI0025789C59|nr:SusC/RagA family TonB-linked outer membrane protein [Sphingobacterium sp. N143]MDM1295392.1 SusC/RagA family TonB-linked outer membrane protein [Sphingobacterium sp. N143]
MKFTLTPFIKKEKDFHFTALDANHVSHCGRNYEKQKPLFARPLSRSLMRINLITLLIGLGLSQVDAHTYAQQISLKKQKSSLESILKNLEKQSGYSFFYKKNDINQIIDLSADIKNAPFKQVLNVILGNANLSYDFFDKTVVVKKEHSSNLQNTPTSPALRLNQIFDSRQQLITGKIMDEEGKPISGATLRLKLAPKNVVISTANGSFHLPLTAAGETIMVTSIGYEPFEFVAKFTGRPIVIRLNKAETKVEEVVVTGMMTRKKESFSGATASFSGQELKMVNNQNVIAGLRALDPSFIQIENNALGSNPNMLPTIELRGQTSISTSTLRDEFSTDPNQPLFILDGFETNLRTIMDLDMNIIQNVTILKDAASTAIYGSRASNGVIVVETIKPKAGKIMLSYTTDMQAQIPDLSSYNMMNAAEKLEFERLSGRYTAGSNLIEQQLLLDSVYNARLQEVLSGVNTYWLKIPVQTGFSHRHSLSARGGEGALVFDAGVNYKNTKGAMKGSGRDDWAANLNLNYRTGKLNIANRAFVTGYTGNESPYGSFSTWVNTNPYYRPLSAAEKFLTYGEDARTNGYSWDVFNPIYNANLSSFNTSKNYVINNNLMMTYDFNSALRLTASGQISKATTNSDDFLSPLNSIFEGVENRKKGSLLHKETSAFGYTANAMLTYSKILQGKHAITANIRGEISESQNRLNGYKAVGFPAASNGNPSFAFGFEQDSKPSASTRVSRRTSLVGSINYSYDQRYNFDVNYNLDGSTSFGSNNLFSPYYSFGTSWNIHNEAFAKKLGWINMLRLRGNIGITGNQNFGNVSQSVFDYNSEVNRFGQGISMSALGAPDLKWQRTRQTSVGMDATLFNNKLNLQLNAYDKFTDPLVVAVTLPSSTGLSAYPFNAGTLDYKGLEATINYSPIYRPKDQFVLTFGLTGAMLKAKYADFDNKLNSLNNEMKESNALIRYRDGYSPNTLWAVRSQGIDPSSGREVFLTKLGEQTFNYNADDLAPVGNSQPLAEGVLRGTLSYKGFTTNILVRYILHKDNFNTALYNKVENMSEEEIVKNNQDKRALYNRWQNPGDMSQFKGISITDITPMSSRFIQRENTFTGESISLGYEFRNRTWLDRLNLSTIRINSIFNDLFYSSTVRRERGIDYPFTRSVSLSLNATFK